MQTATQIQNVGTEPRRLPRWLTTIEMAALLRVHPNTLSRWAANRIVSCLETGRGRRFDPERVVSELERVATR